MLRMPSMFRSVTGLVWCAAHWLVLLTNQAFAVDDGAAVGAIVKVAEPALGISSTFGRWDTPIPLVYDPDNAPAMFADSGLVLALVQQAVDQWQRVSGVRFLVMDADPTIPDDVGPQSRQFDGLVRMSWENIGGAAGRAGPVQFGLDPDKGYRPYVDGQVELSIDASTWDEPEALVSVLVHEFGHLLGLGHSDQSDSVMYANPYNHLQYPREDDIRAMQVLYGEPAQPFDPAVPLAEWIYVPPPPASAAATRFLFKPNFAVSTGAFFALGNGTTAITSITAATPDNQFVVLNSGGIGGVGSPAIADIATLIVTDPSGYIYTRKGWDISCAPNTACQAGISIATTEAIKTVPGLWKAYVVDENANTTLLEVTLPVTTTVNGNEAPQATVRALPGSSATSVRFIIAATDAENDSIQVVWHPPGTGVGNLTPVLGSDGLAELMVNFAQAGEHVFFVELRDDGRRYPGGYGSSDAGDGFQTLLRLTVTLPLTDTDAAFRVVATSGDDPEFSAMRTAVAAPAPTPAVLSAVGNAVAMQGILATSAASAAFTGSTAGFRLGASSDNGATSATTFRNGARVVIAGAIVPQAADVNRAADVFIVVATTTSGGETWRMRNTAGNFETWNTQLASLQPAYRSAGLPDTSAWEIHNGALVVGRHRIYIGYRAANSSVLHFTPNALNLQVFN